MAKNIDYFIKKYLENRPMFFALIRSQEAYLFQKYQKFIKEKILDFGCGDGFFAKTVFGKNKIDVGLDLVNSRVKEAKKEKIYKKIALYNGLKIPYKNNFFQTVISNCVLEHLTNLKDSLKEIRRVLKPGGYFLTTVMTDKWSHYLLGKKVLGKTYINFMNKKQEHFNLFTKKQWQKIFEKIGFKVIIAEEYLNKKQARLIEISHYLAIPSLLSYLAMKKWIIFPSWYRPFFLDKFFSRVLKEKVEDDNGAAIFFVLRKN